MFIQDDTSSPNEKSRQQHGKRQYARPRLVFYGSVTDLTRNGGGASVEQSNQNCKFAPKSVTKACGSERRVKENIVCIDTHPSGFGLYLFDYLPPYREKWGFGRQFGVMIDEVERVMPDAISVDAEGYKLVDYGMLGIDRFSH